MSALGQGQIGAILLLVTIAKEVEEARIGGDDDARGAHGARGVTQRPPRLSPVGRGHAGPELEGRREPFARAPVPRLVEGGMALLGLVDDSHEPVGEPSAQQGLAVPPSLQEDGRRPCATGARDQPFRVCRPRRRSQRGEHCMAK